MTAHIRPGYVGNAVPTADPTAEPRRCRMKDCGLPAKIEGRHPGFCLDHADRLVRDDRFCPSRLETLDEGGTRLICGLCGTELWVLARRDSDREERWAIETVSHPDGRCWVVEGGFRVVRGRQRDALATGGTPLFRTHGPSCPPRVRAKMGVA